MLSDVVVVVVAVGGAAAAATRKIRAPTFVAASRLVFPENISLNYNLLMCENGLRKRTFASVDEPLPSAASFSSPAASSPLRSHFPEYTPLRYSLFSSSSCSSSLYLTATSPPARENVSAFFTLLAPTVLFVSLPPLILALMSPRKMRRSY